MEHLTRQATWGFSCSTLQLASKGWAGCDAIATKWEENQHSTSIAATGFPLFIPPGVQDW